MSRVKLSVAYDGTNYCGWQIQKNGITIEEVLVNKIKKLTGENISLIGASRTDSGVHALENIAVFDTESNIPPERIAYALNRILPEDIVITKSQEVEYSWHPRYQKGISKTYEYHIHNDIHPNPLTRKTMTHISYKLDVDAMRKGAAYLVGEHDFASFCNIKTTVDSTVRTIENIEIEKVGTQIIIRVTGNGFLYNMVRIIAGTLIRVGRSFYEPEKVKTLLEAKERTRESITAPAKGLVLTHISYASTDALIDNTNN